MQTLRVIEVSPEACSRIVILTDALSILKAISSTGYLHLPDYLIQDKKHTSGYPAYFGIPENEEADELAKLGDKEVQPLNKIAMRRKQQ